MKQLNYYLSQTSLFYLHQLAFEAHAMKLCQSSKIKVKNVQFSDCHVDYYPLSPTGNFNIYL